MAHGRLSTEDLAVRPGADGDAREPEQSERLDPDQSQAFLSRWSDVPARVDDPQGAVRDGDSLVVEVVQELAADSARHEDGLEQQWRSGDEPGTEEPRVALQSYRSVFHRLLAT